MLRFQQVRHSYGYDHQLVRAGFEVRGKQQAVLERLELDALPGFRMARPQKIAARLGTAPLRGWG